MRWGCQRNNQRSPKTLLFVFRRFACRPAAFLSVWGGQPEREASLFNLKFLAARVRVYVRQLADGRVFAAVCGQPVFEVGVVGADEDGGVFLVKIDFGGLFLLGKSCSHSKDSNLNKAHIKYLENRFYILAKECDRYSIDNSNVPTKSSVSEAEQAELEEFIYNAKILINALGHKAFESYSEEQPNKCGENPIFSVSAGSGKAYGIRTADGFVLLKDSSIHEVSADSLNIGIKKKVEQSRASGEIKDGILQNDKLFSSSSAAAAFATGYSISGPQQWKTDSGETLKSFETKGTEQA